MSNKSILVIKIKILVKYSMHYTKNKRKHFRRTLLALLCIPICLSLPGTTYYISPNGRDSNPGSLSQPFFTLNKAWTVISAGDIV